VSLEVQKEILTGEEGEEELYSQRSKLYRFRENEWKERGLGDAKLLKHRESGRVRFVLRQEKTGKIVANHYVIDLQPYCDLHPNAGSEKCWVWSAQDFAEEEVATEQFALRFGNPELASAFKDAFDNAKVLNSKVDHLADLVGSTREKSPEEGKPELPAPPASGSPAQQPRLQPRQAAEETSTAETEEPNPFAGMSLLASASDSQGSLFSGSGSSAGASGSTFTGLFSQSSGSSGGLFSSAAGSGGLVGSGGIFGVQTEGLFGSTAGCSGGLFGSPSASNSTPSSGGLFSAAASDAKPPKGQDQEEEADAVEEEEVTTIPGWTPSVTLDVKDCVATGEEDEEELYSQRSKLYRFRDGEWKERGLGDAKLLQHRETRRVRFMLRQEKTGKIVGNHYVLGVPPYCDLQPNAGNKKCWVWSTPDYSEEEPEVERFALRFGTPELAEAFKVAFDNAKELNASIADLPQANEKDSEKASPEAPANAATGPPADGKLSEAPKPTSASPTPTKAAEPEKSSEPAKTLDAAPSPEKAGGLIGQSMGQGSLFSNAASTSSGLLGSSSSSSISLFGGSAGSTASLLSGTTGGLLSSAAGSSSGLFSSAASTSGSLFSSAAGTSGGLFSSAAAGASGGLFGSLAASSGGLFNSTSGASSGGLPQAGTQAGPPKAPEQDEEQYVVEEEVTSIPGWTPSVTLEVKEKVDTGEEDEEELYSQRSKLYRFRDGEWKERGTGEAKILKHRETGKIRFLLRQERTMKISANFFIIDQLPYCDLRPNTGSSKCWVWTAQDCSDGEIVVEQFALKFGTPELASQFEEEFNKAKNPAAASATPEEPDEDQGGEDCDQGHEEDTEAGEPGGFAALLAQQQQQAGWRCPGCRLQWPEEVYECGVCEIPRPGFEEIGAEKAREKQKGIENAAAAFLGTSTANNALVPKATGFAVPPPKKASGVLVPPPAKTGGFVMPPPPRSAQPPDSPQFGASASGSAAAPPPVFGGAPAAPSGAAPPAQGTPSMFAAPEGPGASAPAPLFGAPPSGVQGYPGVGPPLVQPGPAPFFAPQVPPQPHLACGMFGPPPGALAPGAFGAMPVGMGMAPGPAMHPGVVAFPGRVETPEPPGRKPDAALLAAIGEAVTAAHAKASATTRAGPAGDGAVTEAALQKLEERMRRLEERCCRAEEKEKATKAEERARREEEFEDLRQQVGALRRRNQEESDSLQRHQREAKLRIEGLETELAQERQARSSLEGRSGKDSQTTQHAQRLAESALRAAEGVQQDVRQLRQERSSDMATVERSIQALESKVDRCSMDPLRGMSMQNRVMYLQGLHMQQTGRRLEGGREDGGSSSLELKDATDVGGGQRGQLRPLLRHVP